MRLGMGLSLGHGKRSGLFQRVAINNYVGAIGASSVAAAGASFQFCQLTNAQGVGAFQTYACLLSNGSLFFAGSSAVGGKTIQLVRTDHYPVMLNAAKKRGFVVIAAGTNNVDGIAPAGVVNPTELAARMADFRFMAEGYLANGQIPVLTSIMPNVTASGMAAALALRTALAALALELAIPFADLFSAVGDTATGGWLSAAYTTDNIHLSALGGRLTGQVLLDAITPYRNPTHSARLVTAGDDTTGWDWLGGRFVNDSNANGRPDGGGTGLKTDIWSGGSATSTLALTPDPGVVDGNWFTLTKTGTPGSSSNTSTDPTTTGPVPVTEGDHYELAFRIKTNFAAPMIGHEVKFHSTASGSIYLFYFTGFGQDIPIPPLTMALMAPVPASVTLMKFLFGVGVNNVANTDLGSMSLGQLSLRKIA